MQNRIHYFRWKAGLIVVTNSFLTGTKNDKYGISVCISIRTLLGLLISTASQNAVLCTVRFAAVGVFNERFTACSCRHSPGVGWAGITNRVDHIMNGGTPGSTDLCELNSHPVHSPLCVAKNMQYGEGLQICFDPGCPCFQLASSSPRRREQK